MMTNNRNTKHAWQEMGSPTQPSEDQKRQLEAAGSLEQSVPEHTVPLHEGKVNLATNVPRQGVVLLRLRER
jgi:xylan 1,4-beta-xylosidase